MKMDPTYRPTAEELLKHNYFLHDRFPEKFLPALREKVRTEFNENPLLRKFKVDIIMSSSDNNKERRGEESKTRRTIHVEPPRWKISFVQESAKRKFSSDTVNSENASDTRSLISLNRASQKLSSVQKIGQYSKNSLHSLKREEKHTSVSDHCLNKYGNHGFIKMYQDSSKYGSKENPRLEKALDLLSKLNQKNHHRPKSTNKDLHQYSSTTLPPSPPEFQSLQSQSFREPVNKSPVQQQTVLHPNITNISFTKDPKKSPYLIQNNLSQKSVYNQGTNASKTHHLKRLDRCVIVDTASLNPEKSARFKSPPDWLNSVGMAHTKRDSWKGKTMDEFTLPTVPGGSLI